MNIELAMKAHNDAADVLHDLYLCDTHLKAYEEDKKKWDRTTFLRRRMPESYGKGLETSIARLKEERQQLTAKYMSLLSLINTFATGPRNVVELAELTLKQSA